MASEHVSQILQHPQNSCSNIADVDFLTINLSEYHANKFDATSVVADAKTTLEALDQLLGNYTANYGFQIADVKEQWKQELNRLYTTDYHAENYQPEIAGQLDHCLEEYRETLGSSLTQTAVIGEINRSIEDDAIIVGAAGSLPGDLQRMWVSRSPNTYHMEYGYSSWVMKFREHLG